MIQSMYSREEKEQLLEIAKYSIRYGLSNGRAPEIILTNLSAPLREKRASFVTLKIKSMLRGCIGSLTAIQPLALDVANNAFSAAFEDNRFPPLTQKEFPDLKIHISILNPAERLKFADEKELIEQIRPGIDGIILKDKTKRATFLPSVWEGLPDPNEFIEKLKIKAGLTATHFSETMEVYRYTAESIQEEKEEEK